MVPQASPWSLAAFGLRRQSFPHLLPYDSVVFVAEEATEPRLPPHIIKCTRDIATLNLESYAYLWKARMQEGDFIFFNILSILLYYIFEVVEDIFEGSGKGLILQVNIFGFDRGFFSSFFTISRVHSLTNVLLYIFLKILQCQKEWMEMTFFFHTEI